MTPMERAAWTAARRKGLPASVAYSHVIRERVAAMVLEPSFDGGGTDDYHVNAAGLADATAHPSTDAVFGIAVDGLTGERNLSGVRLPDGASATISVSRDDDSSPLDFECYTPEDIQAWRDDQWEYAIVTAEVTMKDGGILYSAMGGVEYGTYWGVSLSACIIHTVAGLISGAS